VPDLVHDQDALADEERIRRELQEERLRAGPALVVVVRDRGDQDVPHPEGVGEDPGRHEPAPRDRQHDVVLAADALCELADEALELVPGDDVLLDLDHAGKPTRGRARRPAGPSGAWADQSPSSWRPSGVK